MKGGITQWISRHSRLACRSAIVGQKRFVHVDRGCLWKNKQVKSGWTCGLDGARGIGPGRRGFSSAEIEDSIKNRVLLDHPKNNVTENVAKLIGRNLLHEKNHPLEILKSKIFGYFDERFGDQAFKKFDDMDPVVGIKNCFDDLLIPKDHVSRRPSDTFYVDDSTCLRPHTSAHQTELIQSGHMSFLCAGDVYRRDEIDQSHYPVFHQMEGVYIFEDENVTKEQVEQHLKDTLEGMVKVIFGDVQMRWVEAYFPFTEPSLELEIWFNDEWLEVLGCGVVHQDIMNNCNLGHKKGWAFGLGLERLAMVLFSIPDIRLFWTKDTRFSEQFADGEIKAFKPYSKYPPCLKDISFWIPSEFHSNDFYELARDIAGDLVERVELIDEFEHPKTKKTSHCYRITYRSMDRNLTNEEIDELQFEIRSLSETKLLVELR